MPAIYPGSVRVFTPKVDLVDTVMASHVNLLQDEMTAVQTTLGTGILSSSWLGTFSQAASHASVGARLANIESGLRATTGVHGLTGTVVGTSDTQTLTNKTLSGASNTLSNIAQSSVTGLVTDLSAKASSTDLTTHTSATAAHGATGAVVGTTNTQTLTNKTIDGASNTLSNIAQSSVTSLSTSLASKANLSGATFTGNVNVVSPTAAGSTGARQITLSTADPSGGADGDVWIKYIA